MFPIFSFFHFFDFFNFFILFHFFIFFHFLSFSVMFFLFPFLFLFLFLSYSFSFLFFFSFSFAFSFSGLLEIRFFWTSISLRFLLTFLIKKNSIFRPVSGVGNPFEASFPFLFLLFLLDLLLLFFPFSFLEKKFFFTLCLLALVSEFNCFFRSRCSS